MSDNHSVGMNTTGTGYYSRTGMALSEKMTLAFLIADQVLGHEMFFGNLQVSGETFYILAC